MQKKHYLLQARLGPYVTSYSHGIALGREITLLICCYKKEAGNSCIRFGKKMEVGKLRKTLLFRLRVLGNVLGTVKLLLLGSCCVSGNVKLMW